MTWLERFGLWLAGLGGWTPCTHPGTVAGDEHAAVLADLATATAGNESLALACQHAEHARDLAEARAASFEARFHELRQTHDALIASIETLVATATTERDSARARLADAAKIPQDTALALTKAQAIADAAEARYAELSRTHQRLVSQVTDLTRERDQAKADFQEYVQKQVGVRVDLRKRAEYLVRLLHKTGKHLEGEFKRHQVYADLIKEFPDLSRRDVSLAIEMAVRAL